MHFCRQDQLNSGFLQFITSVKGNFFDPLICSLGGFDFQCHKELGNVSEAKNWALLALKMPSGSSEVSRHFFEMEISTHCAHRVDFSRQHLPFFSFFRRRIVLSWRQSWEP